MFDRVFISNRGEIALRILRTCRRLGITSVVAYGEQESRAPYVQQADEAVPLGSPGQAGSFLDAERIIQLARAARCQAIHPGYGYLSENAAFARRVCEAGLVFVGPPATAIATLGDKLAAKALARAVGVPVVPGESEPLRPGAAGEERAAAIGYPLLLKPAAGGGGRGMRVVHAPEELARALQAAQDETRRGFGDDRVFAERYIPRARHIEFQLLADAHGHVVHFGERECSVQRRHQKVIEETPSAAVSEELRQRMGELACRLAAAAGYVSAGTVEFLLEPSGEFYLLEMNTRLQVEHPVTELVTGVDLVELQLRVAAGEVLPLQQSDIRLHGWAMEARICAEDPARGFLPTTGMITRYAEPRSPHVRVDSGIEAGSRVGVDYDSLLLKVAAWGEDREAARLNLSQALNGMHLEGLATNVDFANAVVNHPAFAAADLSTAFIEQHFPGGVDLLPPPRESLEYMAIAAVLVEHTRSTLVLQALEPMTPRVGSQPPPHFAHSYVVRAGDETFAVALQGTHLDDRWQLEIDGRSFEVVTPRFEYFRRRLKLQIDGQWQTFRMQRDARHHLQVFFRGLVRTCETYSPREWSLLRFVREPAAEAARPEIRCPMPGVVVELRVAPGTVVRQGQELLQLEAMKMLSAIVAPCDATIREVAVRRGQNVQTDELLLTFACTVGDQRTRR